MTGSIGPGASAPAWQGFPKGRRLRRRPSFLAAQRSGRRVHAEHLTFIVAPNPAPGACRVGLTVSKQVGNAVVRNRVKRLLRETFRREPGWLPAGVALVVIARPGAATLTAAAMVDQWRKVAGRLRQLGAWAAAQAEPGKGPALYLLRGAEVWRGPFGRRKGAGGPAGRGAARVRRDRA